MPTVEFDGPPSWSLDASETGESTKCPWVVAVGFIAYIAKEVANRNMGAKNRNNTLSSIFPANLLKVYRNLV